VKSCALLLLAVALTGCRRDMAMQAHHEPLEASSFFADGAASRTSPVHTIARGQLHEDEQYYTGRVGGQLTYTFPMPVDRALIEHGRERYDIYCSVCHGRTGEGNGIIVQRGFPPPPSLHLDRLRAVPVGHFVEVISNGYGVMYSYASRVPIADRWAIAAYLRALQLSQHAGLADAEAAARAQLEAGFPP